MIPGFRFERWTGGRAVASIVLPDTERESLVSCHGCPYWPSPAGAYRAARARAKREGAIAIILRDAVSCATLAEIDLKSIEEGKI